MSAPTLGPSDWFKSATPFGYARISTGKQTVEDKKTKEARKKTTLKRQMKEVNDSLKASGLPTITPSNWYVEIGSGTNEKREQWKKLREAALNHTGGRAFVVVKDPSRWARDVDDAVIAWVPLKRQGIPLYASASGYQTGTKLPGEGRPTEGFFFLLNSGFAAQVSEVQKLKAEEAVERQKEAGEFPGKGTSLYPFAAKDPLDVLTANIGKLAEKRGVAKLKRIVELETNPEGYQQGGVANLRKQENERIAKLSDDEYKEWYDFRKMIRDMLIERDSDPWAIGTRKGKDDYAMNALYRMVGYYLKEPWNYSQPTNEFIQEVITNYPIYLSDKDKKRRGKR